MTLKTSLPRRSAFWALVTGCLLATTSRAQDEVQPTSVYQRRSLNAGSLARQDQAPLQTSDDRGEQPRRVPGRLAADPRDRNPALPPRRTAPRREQLPQASTGVVPAFYPAPIAAQSESAPNPDPLREAQEAAKPGEHPLMPAIRWAKSGLKRFDQIQDYSCTLVKRERIDGTLGDHEYMSIKVRHEPFSVYMSFVGPAKLKGQEVLYVEGRNDGNLLAHPNGLRGKLIGTVHLKPDSMFAMTGNRYPITQLGLKKLTNRLIEVAEHDAKFGECEVDYKPSARINGRECTCIIVTHPVPRRDFLYHKALVYVDTELNLPCRFEAYEWPLEPGGALPLIEEYTYLNLKLNNGFTDYDFDVDNAAYHFK